MKIERVKYLISFVGLIPVERLVEAVVDGQWVPAWDVDEPQFEGKIKKEGKEDMGIRVLTTNGVYIPKKEEFEDAKVIYVREKD